MTTFVAVAAVVGGLLLAYNLFRTAKDLRLKWRAHRQGVTDPSRMVHGTYWCYHYWRLRRGTHPWQRQQWAQGHSAEHWSISLTAAGQRRREQLWKATR